MAAHLRSTEIEQIKMLECWITALFLPTAVSRLLKSTSLTGFFFFSDNIEAWCSLIQPDATYAIYSLSMRQTDRRTGLSKQCRPRFAASDQALHCLPFIQQFIDTRKGRKKERVIYRYGWNLDVWIFKNNIATIIWNGNCKFSFGWMNSVDTDQEYIAQDLHCSSLIH